MTCREWKELEETYKYGSGGSRTKVTWVREDQGHIERPRKKCQEKILRRRKGIVTLIPILSFGSLTRVLDRRPGTSQIFFTLYSVNFDLHVVEKFFSLLDLRDRVSGRSTVNRLRLNTKKEHQSLVRIVKRYKDRSVGVWQCERRNGGTVNSDTGDGL